MRGLAGSVKMDLGNVFDGVDWIELLCMRWTVSVLSELVLNNLNSGE
jgi:hypothetical protein